MVESEYVEALGVLVVSAARHRSWQPSSPNAAALTTSPPHPTSVNLSAKNLGVGRKKIARPVRNFPKGKNWILNRPACCLPKKSGPSTYLHATVHSRNFLRLRDTLDILIPASEKLNFPQAVYRYTPPGPLRHRHHTSLRQHYNTSTEATTSTFGNRVY